MLESCYIFYFKKDLFNEKREKLLQWIKEYYDYDFLKEQGGDEEIANDDFKKILSIDFSTAKKPEGNEVWLFELNLTLKIPEKYRDFAYIEENARDSMDQEITEKQNMHCNFHILWGEKYLMIIFSGDYNPPIFRTAGVLNLFSDFCQLLNPEIGFLEYSDIGDSDIGEEGVLFWLKGKKIKRTDVRSGELEELLK